MILNLDFNPYINKKYIVNSISLEKEIKSNSSNYIPKGSIIISDLLNAFGEKSLLIGFLGGLNGERYHNMLFSKDLAHEFISIKDETKIKIDIMDIEDNHMTITDKEPRVTREDVKEFLALYINLISDSQIICGSSDILPIGLTDEIYFQLIVLANKKRKKFILQADVEELKKGIEAIPYMVVLDKQKLEDLINIDLQCENEIIKGANYILHKGIEFVVILMPNNEMFLLGQEKGYKISGTIGDTNTSNLKRIVAGFALGINRNYDLDMTLRLAYAFNSYGASDNSEEIDISEIKKIMVQAEISFVNYD